MTVVCFSGIIFMRNFLLFVNSLDITILPQSTKSYPLTSRPELSYLDRDVDVTEDHCCEHHQKQHKDQAGKGEGKDK